MTQRMILCAGMQSGGTTLLSWCFLQRADTNGVLDMPNDELQTSFDVATEPILWVKMTVGAFRWLDASEVYRDLGWNPEPLLVVRDARAAYDSLLDKPWGVNGTTGEEPPLRLRFRRFLRDWRLFRERGWPIVAYERLLEDAPSVLRELCRYLNLPWDDGMLSWPKSPDDIAYMSSTNPTFEASAMKGGFEAALIPARAEPVLDALPDSELAWLEREFADYRRAHDYPAELQLADDRPIHLKPPSFEGTAREWWMTKYQRVWDENESLRRKWDALQARKAADNPANDRATRPES